MTYAATVANRVEQYQQDERVDEENDEQSQQKEPLEAKNVSVVYFIDTSIAEPFLKIKIINIIIIMFH